MANSLVALSSSAVLAVYAAGYLRTKAAAQRFESDGAPRRVAPVEVVAPATPPPVVDPLRIEPTTKPTPPTASVPKKKVARAAPRPTPPPEASPAPEPVAAPPVAPVIPDVERKPVEPPAPPAVKPPSPYKDGAYSGWGTSRHGDIQATVVIEGGRIVSASITQCLTRYSCSWIAALPPQIVARQSAECDFVSGATQSTNAFYYAVLEALAKAK